MFMTSAVYRTKRLDEVRPPPGRRESETPELLASYLAKIGRGSLLTHQEEISLSKRARDGHGPGNPESKSQMSLATALLALCPYLEGAFPSVTRRPTFLMPRAFTSSAVPSAICSKGMLTAPVIAPAIMCMAPPQGMRPSPHICRAGVGRLVCLW